MSDTSSLQPINILYSQLDKDISNIIDTNAGSMQIDISLVPRWNFNSEEAKPTHLIYNKDVTDLYLEDNLNSIGMSGYMNVTNETSYLDIFLGKLDDYYVVINITEYMTNSNDTYVPLYKYEPYIFVATSVETITPIDSDKKVLRIRLEDCLTNILKTHSYGNLVMLYPSIWEITNYKDFFNIVLDYCKEFIKINCNDKYDYHKDILYTSDMTLGGGIYNGNDVDSDFSKLVQNSLMQLRCEDTIYEAMLQMLKDCCTTLKTPSSFSKNNDVVGDLLIPFFFKEEYGDRWGFYYELWGKSVDSNIDSILTQMKQSNLPDRKKQGDSPIVLNTNQKCPLLLRTMTMRDIYMPFHSAFKVDDSCCVYESINPKNGDEEGFIPLNGFYQHEITALQYIPISIPAMKKLKKNMIFVDCNVGGGAGGACSIVFYSWLFDYYQNVFLNCNLVKSKQNNIKDYRIPNLVPAFHLMQRNESIPHASGEGKSFSNKFDEINSYTIVTETEDSLHEALRIIGKNISAFMLGNEAYSFKIRGNLLRRPNEIIKYAYRGSKNGTQQTISMQPSISLSDYVFFYVKKVAHHFNNNQYWNTIVGCKLAEIYQTKQTKQTK